MKRRKIIGKRHAARKDVKTRGLNNFLITRDFSSVEDAPNSFDIIRNIVYRAGKNAAAESKVAGLPQIFARNNQIVRIKQNGEEEVITTAEASAVTSGSFYIRYKPFTILHVRKK